VNNHSKISEGGPVQVEARIVSESPTLSALLMNMHAITSDYITSGMSLWDVIDVYIKSTICLRGLNVIMWTTNLVGKDANWEHGSYTHQFYIYGKPPKFLYHVIILFHILASGGYGDVHYFNPRITSIIWTKINLTKF
jgi:hypothetical protein